MCAQEADGPQEPWGRRLQRRLGDDGTSDSCFSKSGIQEESISLGPLTASPPPPPHLGSTDTRTQTGTAE